MKKPKLEKHYQQCHSSVSCIDCSTTFSGPAQFKSHTTCISEAEKYQGSLYKGPKVRNFPVVPSRRADLMCIPISCCTPTSTAGLVHDRPPILPASLRPAVSKMAVRAVEAAAEARSTTGTAVRTPAREEVVSIHNGSKAAGGHPDSVTRHLALTVPPSAPLCGCRQ